MIRYFQVAGLCFAFEAPDGFFDGIGLDNYRPFECETPTGDLLFSLQAERTEKAPSVEGKLVYDACENDFPRLTFYESAQAFRVDMAPLPELPYCASLIADKSFRSAKLSIWGSPKFSIDNAMMLLYAFASAPYAALEMHASVSVKDSKAYLFLGKSGTGKSTHSRLWRENIPGVSLLNDDNPIVRIIEGNVLCFGSPWSGKTPCYKAENYPVGAIVRIERSSVNTLKPQAPVRAYASIFSSVSAFRYIKGLSDNIHATVSRVVESVPCYVMECRPDAEAALVCYNGLTGGKL